MIGSISIRNCPSCKCFTLQRDYMAEVQLYVCRTCGFAVNEWNLNTGSAYNPPVTYSAYTAPKKPKPTSFKRTKTKKPTKKQLEELSAAIDNQLEIQQ